MPEVTAKKGCGPVLTDDKAWYTSGKTQPLLDGVNAVHYPITTKSEKAQHYFDQGLVLAYGFNHAEAARSFWQAHARGQHLRHGLVGLRVRARTRTTTPGMEPDSYRARLRGDRKGARRSWRSCTEKEQGLIDAMALRYAATAPEDRSPLDHAYSDALRALTAKYPDDPDIAAMFAESLMDQHPWDLYDARWRAEGVDAGDHRGTGARR